MSDDKRYIHYLQKQLLTEGYEDCFIKLGNIKDSSNLNIYLQRWNELYPNVDLDHILQKIRNFQPTTIYDDFFAKEYYSEKLKAIEIVLARLNIQLTRKLTIETSTSSSPTPFARATDGDHILFIGRGTMSFCNYWAKALTAIVMEYSSNTTSRIESRIQIIDCFKKNPSLIIICANLALRYSFTSSLIGFGPLEIPQNHMPYRHELLEAMETFVMCHEISHFIAEEKLGQDYKGILTPEKSIQLELFCDELGLQICRELDKDTNWLSFCGIGALAYFGTFNLVEEVRELVSAKYPSKEFIRNTSNSTHPDTTLRIEFLKNNLISKSWPDQRESIESFFNEYELLLDVVRKEVLGIFMTTLKTV